MQVQESRLIWVSSSMQGHPLFNILARAPQAQQGSSIGRPNICVYTIAPRPLTTRHLESTTRCPECANRERAVGLRRTGAIVHDKAGLREAGEEIDDLIGVVNRLWYEPPWTFIAQVSLISKSLPQTTYHLVRQTHCC